MNENKSAFTAGFGLLWRRQRVFWWIFAVNLLCGVLGTTPGFIAVYRAVGHSLVAQTLTRRFDIGMFVELIRVPDVNIIKATTASYLFAFVFFVFMLFVMGGVLETYRTDQRLTAGEFFANSGAFFWRFVRLLLLSIVPFVVVNMIFQGLNKLATYAGDHAIADQVGIFMGWGATAVFLLLALWVRMWFDVAQVRAVARNERGMWRNTWRAWRLVSSGLYGTYLLIAILAWATLAAGLVIWAKLPATATGLMFIVFELIVVAQLAARLWQLASATSWYRGQEEMIAPVPLLDATTAPPLAEPTGAEVVGVDAGSAQQPSASPDSAPETVSPPKEPSPELPPADA